MTRRTSTRRPSAHARRPGPALRRRISAALPAPGRIVAALLTAALVGGLLALINGPWLRVARVAWAGEHYTPAAELEHALASLDGAALLTVDATAVATELERLPAVAKARVDAILPDAVRVTIVEKQAAFVWQTSAVRLVGVADGTLIGQIALRATLSADLAALPLIDDRRVNSRDIIVGDRIDSPTLAAALRLWAVDPAALGSKALALDVRLTDDDGFLLASGGPVWQADFGSLEERVNAQVAAVRTLFSAQPEGGVSWVDARNPGRVYWRP
jgi:hypothetical protein